MLDLLILLSTFKFKNKEFIYKVNNRFICEKIYKNLKYRFIMRMLLYIIKILYKVSLKRVGER